MITEIMDSFIKRACLINMTSPNTQTLNYKNHCGAGNRRATFRVYPDLYGVWRGVG